MGKRIWLTAQVAMTYVGTVVGAGFATGQEILHFFTRYGGAASLTIFFASVLFIVFGTRLLLIAHDLRARSYEDLNRYLFGDWWGRMTSLFMLIVLFGVTTVMLAGAGSLGMEQWHWSYQGGMLMTIALTYFLLRRGMRSILLVNSLIVPFMFVFAFLMLSAAIAHPLQGPWSSPPGHDTWHLSRMWFSALLYVAFNLAMTQAVLVPLGAEIRERAVLLWGGIWGGIGIGFLLLCGHLALSSQWPGIAQFEIPMSHLMLAFGPLIQMLLITVIFSEIFTTFMADVYGVSRQLEQRFAINQTWGVPFTLGICYLISQIGFTTLLQTLYPIFGFFSLIWLVRLMFIRKAVIPLQ